MDFTDTTVSGIVFLCLLRELEKLVPKMQHRMLTIFTQLG